MDRVTGEEGGFRWIEGGGLIDSTNNFRGGGADPPANDGCEKFSILTFSAREAIDHHRKCECMSKALRQSIDEQQR